MILLENINDNMKKSFSALLKDTQRFDITIDSILDGEYKKCSNIKIYVDKPLSPTVIEIIQGTFIIFAGDADCTTAAELMKNIPSHYGIQPVSEKWILLAKKIHGENLNCRKRFIFSPTNLNKNHLTEIISNNAYRNFLKKIDFNTAKYMMNDDLQKYHFLNFSSPESFITNSFGFCIEKNNKILSACTACLLSKKSVEVSIITDPSFRKKGLASLAAAKFILYCLENNLTPHWDAANQPSCLLAEKLGYEYAGDYNIYYKA